MIGLGCRWDQTNVRIAVRSMHSDRSWRFRIMSKGMHRCMMNVMFIMWDVPSNPGAHQIVLHLLLKPLFYFCTAVFSLISFRCRCKAR